MRNFSGNISLTLLSLKHVKDSILFILLFFLLLAKMESDEVGLSKEG